jgi:hypothetical protein
MPSIHPITIRRLFLGLLILLPLQYAIAGLVQFLSGREPWPALVMPGFKATWDGHAPLLAPQGYFHCPLRRRDFEAFVGRYRTGSFALLTSPSYAGSVLSAC